MDKKNIRNEQNNENMNNDIELKLISNLLGMNFFIPSYQRGFRWTAQQVKDLLNDIDVFTAENNSWYCLQPLVVKKMSDSDIETNELPVDKEWYEVVDGQQYKQFGNAVTIPAIEEMAKFMKKCLKQLEGGVKIDR